MMTAYYNYIHREDLDSVENTFSDFNKTFNDICDASKDITGTDIRNGVNAKVLHSSCEALKQKFADKEKPDRYFKDIFNKTSTSNAEKVFNQCTGVVGHI